MIFLGIHRLILSEKNQTHLMCIESYVKRLEMNKIAILSEL